MTRNVETHIFRFCQGFRQTLDNGYVQHAFNLKSLIQTDDFVVTVISIYIMLSLKSTKKKNFFLQVCYQSAESQMMCI